MMLIPEQREAVLLLTLNRPEKRNALHPDLIHDLAQTLARTGNDDSVNVVVISGAGPSFCAGLDLNHLLSLEPEGRVAYLQSAFALFQLLYTLPQPVIAAINGPAVAGGFDLAVFCDLRLCAPSATFAQTEVLLGEKASGNLLIEQGPACVLRNISTSEAPGFSKTPFILRSVISCETATLCNAVNSQSSVTMVVLDLGQVSTIDAGGLGVMLELREQTQSRGIAFKLMNVTGLVRSVLEVTCLDSVFEVTSEVEVLSAAPLGRRASMMEFLSCA